MSRILLCAVTLLAVGGQFATAEEASPRTLTFSPQAVTQPASANRLLPAAPQLREGNAVIELLRLPWEQTIYMSKTAQNLGVMLRERPYDDPNLPIEANFDGFAERLRRAAYTRDADWDYDTQSGSLAMVLLPDAQGLRQLAGYGMSIWINAKIAAGDLDEAREGIAVQLACARHIGKAPFLVNRLVAEAIAQESLDRVELLIQQEDAPNLYWSLALLPSTIGDDAVCWQWEEEMLVGSVPGLGRPLPPVGDRRWREAAKELPAMMRLLAFDNKEPRFSTEVSPEMRELIKNDLAERGYSLKEIADMGDEELGVRRMIWRHESTNAQVEAAFGLPDPEALQRLVEIEKELGAGQVAGDPAKQGEVSLLASPLRIFGRLRQFDRRRRMLQTVEAIRDYAAAHQGEFPATLADLRLPAPNDPLTGKPFDYQRLAGKAILKGASLEPQLDALEKGLQLELVAR